jgi:hypothetical protein
MPFLVSKMNAQKVCRKIGFSNLPYEISDMFIISGDQIPAHHIEPNLPTVYEHFIKMIFLSFKSAFAALSLTSLVSVGGTRRGLSCQRSLRHTNKHKSTKGTQFESCRIKPPKKSSATLEIETAGNHISSENDEDVPYCVSEDFPCEGEGSDMVYVCHYSARKGYQTFCVPESDSDILRFYPYDYCGACEGGYGGVWS